MTFKLSESRTFFGSWLYDNFSQKTDKNHNIKIKKNNNQNQHKLKKQTRNSIFNTCNNKNLRDPIYKKVL